MMSDSERAYLDLLRRLLEDGDPRIDRTGVGASSLFGETLRFDLAQGAALITTKRVYWKLAAKEMLWFLSGETNIRPLVAAGVGIWTDWPLAAYRRASGEAIDQAGFEKRILEDESFARRWGDLGPVYGRQWRRWRGPEGREYDQIARLISDIRRDPSSRRLLFSGWNVAEIDAMALPPCHMVYQFHVARGRLSCVLFQRSADAFLGVPFNLFGAGLLTAMLAQQCDLEPGVLTWFGGDVHLYASAREQAREQIAREPRRPPRLLIGRRPPSIDAYAIEDFEVADYDPWPPIKAEVAV
ncbi:MAG TPA: thymidylate synthase [Beijerinckiaceae bacterium]|nr:thymidylate synthase [Beijerinckiaceae bacterium]